MKGNLRSFVLGLTLLASLLSQRLIGDEIRTSDKEALKERIDKRVQAWQPRKEERRLDDIGWAKDIRDALPWRDSTIVRSSFSRMTARRIGRRPWRYSAAEAAPPP